MITNGHVVESCATVNAIDMTGQKIPLRVVRILKSDDLALLKANIAPSSFAVFQISAPVQPGNSGGPLVDSKGLVIGVVVAQLTAMAVRKATPDIPQNVNFAIKSLSIINLLDMSSVSRAQGKHWSIASRLAAATHPCFNVLSGRWCA